MLPIGKIKKKNIYIFFSHKMEALPVERPIWRNGVCADNIQIYVDIFCGTCAECATCGEQIMLPMGKINKIYKYIYFQKMEAVKRGCVEEIYI